MYFFRNNALVQTILCNFTVGLGSCLFQDIVGKQKAFAIISRSAKSLGNLLEIT